MGTRSEIYIRNNENTIEFYKHFDGYPSFMIPYLKEFAIWIQETVGSQKHWMAYIEDVSAYLIAYDWENAKNTLISLEKWGCKRDYIRPDIRPRGLINDFIEYVYIIDIKSELDENKLFPRRITWTLKAYELEEFALNDDDRELIRKHKEDEIKHLIKIHDEVILDIKL